MQLSFHEWEDWEVVVLDNIQLYGKDWGRAPSQGVP